MKFIARHIDDQRLGLLLILGLAIVTWFKLLNQAFLGESYFYFDKALMFSFSPQALINETANYANIALICFIFFKPLFQDNISLYFGFELAVIILIYFSLYVVLNKLFKNIYLSLVIVCLFIANFTCSFFTFFEGGYQRFIQRIPATIPLLFALYFLHKARNGSWRNFGLSLLLFTFSMYLASFTIFIFPFFFIHSLIGTFKKSFKSFIQGLVFSCLYLIISWYFVHSQPLVPHQSLFNLITSDRQLAEKVIYQFPLLIFPLSLITNLGTFFHEVPPNLGVVRFLTFLTLPLLIVGLIFLYKHSKKETGLFRLCLSSFLAIFPIGVLNVYVQKVNPLMESAQNGYFFIPSLFMSILLGTFFATIWKYSRKNLRLMLTIVFCLDLIVNVILISNAFDKGQYKSNAEKKFLKYVKNISPQFTKDSVLVGPARFLFPNPNLIEAYYFPYGDLATYDIKLDWKQKIINTDKNKVFVFDYTDGPSVGESFGPDTGQLIDLTSQFRMGKL